MNKLKIFIVLACGILCCGNMRAGNNAATASYDVVPLPQSVVSSPKEGFTVNADTRIVYPEGNEQLRRDAQFLSDYIADITALRLETTSARQKNAVVLSLNSKIDNNEGYVLTVSKRGISIEGKTPAGVFYGIQTLRKSLPVDTTLTSVNFPSVVIKDAPRFSYRGMMLDCARHYFPVEFVKQYIDLIAMHNMNVFHWHLTEDQGWRIEIKKYPELAKKGSVRRRTVLGHNSQVYDEKPYGGYYTQDEAREIVRYAAERYITVIPEIDMPGHMMGALSVFPDLGCTGGPYEVSPIWGVMPDVLCLGNEKTYSFCEDVLKELIDIFPSKYIHLGGDETPTVRWKECPKCQKLMEREHLSLSKLQGYFTKRMEKFLNDHGRSMIGWDEILEGDINKSATVMSWRGQVGGAKASKLGHDVIMAPNTHCYFDYYQTHSDNEKWNEPLLIGGNLPIEQTYALEPVPDSLSAEEAKHIIGVQANLWTEYINDPSLAEYQVIPRMGALSEIQWYGGKKDFEAWKKRQERMLNLYDAYRLYYATHLWPKRISVASENGFK